jgi:hypothetical protein
MSVRAGALVTLVTAVVLSGCRIDVGTDVAFDRTGGGEVAVSVRIDGATLRELDAAGVDPELDVALALGDDSAWQGERSVDTDGGLVVTYRRTFVDGPGATALLGELSDGVAPQDPALRLDLAVATSSAGAVRLQGSGALSPPATLGVRIDGVPVGPSGDELARLTADAVRAELVVRVPGRVLEHDADVLSDGVARWELPVGDARSIVLVSEDVPLWRRVPAVLVVAAVVLLGAGIRWRRRTPTGPPAARAEGAGGADDGQR